jgi:hypothetical protein
VQPRPFLSRLIREPLLHFALIGALVFFLYPGNATTPATPVVGSYVIDVTPQVRDRLAAQFAATWNRQPEPDELAGLLSEHVREEVLYREALALGLDRDDPVIRQRMRLKMEFLGESAVGAMTPTDAELAAWYAANAAEYAAPATITFGQIMLTDPAEAEATLAALAAGADPATLGRGTLLPAQIDAGSAQAVDGLFGTGFFDAMSQLAPAIWAGPIESAYGPHIVRLDAITTAKEPPLETVRDAVLEDWRRDQAEALRESQFQAFLSRYTVNLPDDGPTP